jgi:hypothetical protein
MPGAETCADQVAAVGPAKARGLDVMYRDIPRKTAELK